MVDLPTGTVTLLFTDIEGSTRLLEQLGDRYVQMLAAHQELLRAAFDEHHGHEVGTEGDAFFVAFAKASRATPTASSPTSTMSTSPSRGKTSMRLCSSTPACSRSTPRRPPR
jgi:class 3 adenylate cyclase